MCERDYLWCALHLLLDEEERAADLCPSCRVESERALCPACGAATEDMQGGHNENFDAARFLKLKEEC